MHTIGAAWRPALPLPATHLHSLCLHYCLRALPDHSDSEMGVSIRKPVSLISPGAMDIAVGVDLNVTYVQPFNAEPQVPATLPAWEPIADDFEVDLFLLCLSLPTPEQSSFLSVCCSGG